jgi:hypothetical protein
MSQLVKMKRQAKFKDSKRFAAFKGLVEHKKRCIQLEGSGSLMPKKAHLHKNELNKVLLML